MATKMNSLGYAVVSVDFNHYINGVFNGKHALDDINARGALILKTLHKFTTDLKTINGTDVDLSETFDFTNIGLMGHSRGGEGVRATYTLLQNNEGWKSKLPNTNIKGIFEIGPVDFHGKFIADNTFWAVLIPTCDGDISDFQGTIPFYRMNANPQDTFRKSVISIVGANHNFFNTNWKRDDFVNVKKSRTLDMCPSAMWSAGATGSPAQQEIGLKYLEAFFETAIKGQSNWDELHENNTEALVQTVIPSKTDVWMDILSTDVILGGKATAISVEDATKETFPDNFPNGDYAVLRANTDTLVRWKEAESTAEFPITIPADSPSGAYEAIDIEIGDRRFCYQSTECPEMTKSFKIALVLKDGSTRRMLQNKVNNTIPATTINATNGANIKYLACTNNHGNTTTATSTTGTQVESTQLFEMISDGLNAYPYYVHPDGVLSKFSLYQTVRIPFSTFNVTDVTQLKGLRFQFTEASGSIMVNRILGIKA